MEVHGKMRRVGPVSIHVESTESLVKIANNHVET